MRRRLAIVALGATALVAALVMAVSPGGADGDVSSSPPVARSDPVLLRDRFDGRQEPSSVTRALGERVRAATASARVLVEDASLPRAGVLALRTEGGSLVAGLTVGTGGTLGLVEGYTGVERAVPFAATPGSWHTLALTVAVAGEASWVAVAVDGAVVETVSTDLGELPVAAVQVGQWTRPGGADLRVDDVLVERADAADRPVVAPSTRTDPVLFAAGDIACDPRSASFHGGAGSANSCRMKAVSDLVLGDSAATAVAALGDVQYYCGAGEAFERSYDPTWGRFLDITHPAVGNHEYIDAADEDDQTACDPSGTAGPYFDYFGERAGLPGQGYYSYDLGTWHVVVLNTTCSQAGGCHVGSPQERWLRRDLAAHPARCTLAYFHIPVWSSGGRASENARAFTRDLVAAGADVVLAGHDHLYERFAPQDADGRPDPGGLRAWVVGTGGANHTGVAKVTANSAVVDPFTFGVLRLVLRDGSYDWTFVPAPGGSFTDTGTGSCH